MELKNLILNINIDETNGQSTVINHLLTYSRETGVLPQKLKNITNAPRYIFKNGDGLRNLQDIRKGFQNVTREENWQEQIKESLQGFTDLVGDPILESKFKFMLPSSINAGNLIGSNETYFVAKQEHHLAILDSLKRFMSQGTKCLSGCYINDFIHHYKLENFNYDDALKEFANRIDPSENKQSDIIEYIKGKPFFILDRLLEEGYDLVIKNDVESYFDLIDQSYQVYFDLGIKTIDVSKLNEEDYYTEMCSMLEVTPNYELYRIFKDTFFEKDEREQLLFLSGSEFIADTICQYIKQKFS